MSAAYTAVLPVAAATVEFVVDLLQCEIEGACGGRSGRKCYLPFVRQPPYCGTTWDHTPTQNGTTMPAKEAAKDARIEVRIESDRLDYIQRAAAAVHEKPSDFVRKAAYDRASEVLAQDLVTMMPSAQFDELLAALDLPGEAPRLAAAAAKPRAFIRK